MATTLEIILGILFIIIVLLLIAIIKEEEDMYVSPFDLEE